MNLSDKHRYEIIYHHNGVLPDRQMEKAARRAYLDL